MWEDKIDVIIQNGKIQQNWTHKTSIWPRTALKRQNIVMNITSNWCYKF